MQQKYSITIPRNIASPFQEINKIFNTPLLTADFYIRMLKNDMFLPCPIYKGFFKRNDLQQSGFLKILMVAEKL